MNLGVANRTPPFEKVYRPEYCLERIGSKTYNIHVKMPKDVYCAFGPMEQDDLKSAEDDYSLDFNVDGDKEEAENELISLQEIIDGKFYTIQAGKMVFLVTI